MITKNLQQYNEDALRQVHTEVFSIPREVVQALLFIAGILLTVLSMETLGLANEIHIDTKGKPRE